MKLIIIKSAFRWLPEVFLTASVLYYWFLTSTLLNPFAIGLLAILIAQFYYNKRSVGITLGAVVSVLTLYMFLALFSEVSEFNPFYPEGLKLLTIGTLYLGATLFASISLLVKHIPQPSKKIIIEE